MYIDARCSGIECADCVMNLDQYRAVTKTELDIADHADVDRPGDSGEITTVAFIRRIVTTHAFHETITYCVIYMLLST